MGCWATVQLVPLSECFVICRAGIFCRRQRGAARYGNVALVWGAGLMLGQGRAMWPEEDSGDVTLGKCPFHGARIHPSSPLSHVPICWEGGLKATLQGWKFFPKMASHQVLQLNVGLATQQHAQSLAMHSSHVSASPHSSRPSEELLAKEVRGISWLEARQAAHAAEPTPCPRRSQPAISPAYV